MLDWVLCLVWEVGFGKPWTLLLCVGLIWFRLHLVPLGLPMVGSVSPCLCCEPPSNPRLLCVSTFHRYTQCAKSMKSISTAFLYKFVLFCPFWIKSQLGLATLVDELILASLIWSLLIQNKKTSNNLIELMTIGKAKLFSEPCFSVWVNLV